MATEPLDHEHAELKKRATRRLIVAVTLVLAAVAVLTILGREKTAAPPVTTAPVTPIIAPPPEPAPSVTEPAPEAVPAAPEAAPPAPEQAPAAAPAEPPPPPKVVNNALPPPGKPAARPQPAATRMEPAPATPAPAATAPAKTAPQPAPKAAPEAAPAKGYVLQLGVFTNYANAQALQAKLTQAGIKSYAETRVNVGPFLSKAEADQAMAKIRALGIGVVVVPAH